MYKLKLIYKKLWVVVVNKKNNFNLFLKSQKRKYLNSFIIKSIYLKTETNPQYSRKMALEITMSN